MGMTTTVIWDGYSTPFEMGTRSGNMPESRASFAPHLHANPFKEFRT
jgi:hypothetical protein